MTRLNVVLLVVLVVSAMYLVQVQYRMRTLVTALDHAVAEAHRLEMDNNRLQAEKSDESKSLRVESMAKSRLAMRTTTPAITVYVTAPAALVTAAQGATPEAPASAAGTAAGASSAAAGASSAAAGASR